MSIINNDNVDLYIIYYIVKLFENMEHSNL